MPLILDGEIQKSALEHIQKNKYWLMKELEKSHLQIRDVFYAFYKGKKIYVVLKPS